MKKSSTPYLIGIVIITIGIVTTSSQLANAQPNNSNTTTVTTTSNYTKIFSEDEEFQRCLDFMPDQCFPVVDVLYESPTLIALKSQYIDLIWKAVDTVEKDGFEIDGMTSYSITSDVGLSSTNYVNLLVVLSKNISN